MREMCLQERYERFDREKETRLMVGRIATATFVVWYILGNSENKIIKMISNGYKVSDPKMCTYLYERFSKQRNILKKPNHD